MIPVDELEEESRSQHSATSPSVVVDPLTDEEDIQLDFIDAQLDPAARAMAVNRTDMFDATFDTRAVPMHILFALKQKWELGGWTVGALQKSSDTVQMIFVRPRERVSSRAVVKSLQARDLDAAPEEAFAETVITTQLEPRTSTPLLVRMPTRGRADQALRVLGQYREMATTKIAIEVVIDEDDTSMNNALVLQKLNSLDCTITIGKHKSKIEAVNAGRVNDWGILLLASDDMVPAVRGYDERVIADMTKHYPLLDGALNYNDGYNKEHSRVGYPVLNTLPIIGRHLYEEFGYVYYPGYGSLYCDDEMTRVLTSIRRMTFIDEIIIEHRHHAAGKAKLDALYTFNDGKHATKDAGLFEERAARNFDAPELLLSILICTIPERAPMLARLVSWLRWQMRNQPRRVEICTDSRLGVTVGEKRQALLERSVGEYVAFIDDDDWVSSDYVSRVVRQLLPRESMSGSVLKRPDCLSLIGEMTTTQGLVERFEHSLKNRVWETVDGVHLRCPNHLNVVRRELAMKVGFVSKNVGEDHDYSMRLLSLLKDEASTGTKPLYYYFYQPNQSVQTRGAQ